MSIPTTANEDDSFQQEEEMMPPPVFMTNKRLTQYLHDGEQELFAGLEYDKTSGVIGSTYQPWELLYTIVQTFSNLS